MIKYWCRLESGTKNIMLNAAYKELKIVGTDWINRYLHYYVVMVMQLCLKIHSQLI